MCLWAYGYLHVQVYTYKTKDIKSIIKYLQVEKNSILEAKCVMLWLVQVYVDQDLIHYVAMTYCYYTLTFI